MRIKNVDQFILTVSCPLFLARYPLAVHCLFLLVRGVHRNLLGSLRYLDVLMGITQSPRNISKFMFSIWSELPGNVSAWTSVSTPCHSSTWVSSVNGPTLKATVWPLVFLGIILPWLNRSCLFVFDTSRTLTFPSTSPALFIKGRKSIYPHQLEISACAKGFIRPKRSLVRAISRIFYQSSLYIVRCVPTLNPTFLLSNESSQTLFW